MGMFSFYCSMSGQAISSEAPHVVLYLLKDGEVQEVMSGPYSGYGSVEAAKQVVHMVLRGDELVDQPSRLNPSFCGEDWTSRPWADICDLMFDDDKSNGIHAVIGNYDPNYVPTLRSEDDPNQGWGDGDDEDEDDECPDCGCIDCECDDNEM